MAIKVFYIAPIGEPGSEQRQRSDTLLSIVRNALPEYEIWRADDISASGSITATIIEWVLKSDLVIADLTGGNANVYYELGLRHAVQMPFVTITSEPISNLPFDLRDMEAIKFDFDRIDTDSPKKLRKRASFVLGNNWRAFDILSLITNKTGVRMARPQIYNELHFSSDTSGANLYAVDDRSWSDLSEHVKYLQYGARPKDLVEISSLRFEIQRKLDNGSHDTVESWEERCNSEELFSKVTAKSSADAEKIGLIVPIKEEYRNDRYRSITSATYKVRKDRLFPWRVGEATDGFDVTIEYPEGVKIEQEHFVRSIHPSPKGPRPRVRYVCQALVGAGSGFVWRFVEAASPS